MIQTPLTLLLANSYHVVAEGDTLLKVKDKASCFLGDPFNGWTDAEGWTVDNVMQYMVEDIERANSCGISTTYK